MVNEKLQSQNSDNKKNENLQVPAMNGSFPTKIKTEVRELVENEETSKIELSNENLENVDTSSAIPENVPLIFKCKICSETFSSKLDVNKHLSTVHEGKKVIKINGREVKTRNLLIQNQILESTMVPELSDYFSPTFQCKFCTRRFATKNGISNHLVSAHENETSTKTGYLKYKCTPLSNQNRQSDLKKSWVYQEKEPQR